MKKLYKNDIILNLIIILICIAVPVSVFFASRNEGKTAVISVDGEVVKEFPLSRNAEFGIEGVTVELRDGAAKVTHSDCPDGLCMNTKKAENVGDSIICVPNKVSVRIVGNDSKKEADAVAG